MKGNMLKALGEGIKKRSPALLMGVGIAGMITTTILAVRATPKALELMDERKQEDETEELTPVEVVQTVWKCYIPAAVTAGIGIACLIESHKIHGRRNAALAAVYSLSESALREYQEKVIETVGEKKEAKIRDEIDKDRVTKNPPSHNKVYETGKGNTLCYDSLSGRYFKSDMDQIKRALNNTNEQLLNDMYISLNEFYTELGLEEIEVGDFVGWDIQKGQIKLSFSSQLTSDTNPFISEGIPCLVISHINPPHYRY